MHIEKYSVQFTWMIRRKLHNTIVESLQKFTAVGLIGARQVGKTTLAKMIAKEWPHKSIDPSMKLS